MPMQVYIERLAHREDILLPFVVTGTLGAFDIRATVKGGGKSGIELLFKSFQN
jgi:ribosomal protein S9